MVTDALELELRQLQGVVFVSFSEGPGAMIELMVAPGVDHAKVREEAMRCVANHLDHLAEIRVNTVPHGQAPASGTAGRVKLALVFPNGGGASVGVQLDRGALHAESRAVAGDTAAVGRAVLEALRGLGASATFDVVGLHALPSEWGAGLLAVLRDPVTGELRRGVASGSAPADAAARAVLAALNRSI